MIPKTTVCQSHKHGEDMAVSSVCPRLPTPEGRSLRIRADTEKISEIKAEDVSFLTVTYRLHVCMHTLSTATQQC